MITAITPTGDRPLAFSLCRRWMEQQTKSPDQWIIVDDGITPMAKIPLAANYVRREPRENDPKYTLADNLKAAIPHIRGDKILIIEDDEYYSPGYVAAMAAQLGKFEVAGMGRSRYYHLPTGGYLIIGNMRHASLAQTGFMRSFIPEFRKVLIPGKLYIDFAIWKAARSKHVFLDSPPLYVGIKGLPGRPGIGRGHDPKIYRGRTDPGRKILKQWISKDYQVYLDLLGKKNAK